MVIPQKQISFSVLENDYTVNFPTNGQYIDIESMKVRLTGDSYHAMAEGKTVSSNMAVFTVDMIAFFNVCCPEIKKNLKVKNFSELDMISSKTLLKVYMNVILPWLTEWELLLNSVDEEDKKENKEAIKGS